MMRFIFFLSLGLFFSCDLLSSLTGDGSGSGDDSESEYDDSFQTSGFILNVESINQAINASLSGKIPNGSSYEISGQVEGLNIDSIAGKLSFNSLKDLATAGGKVIKISYQNASGVSDTFEIPLQIKAANKTELAKLIRGFLSDLRIGSIGNYNAIDTSQVKDMSFLFSDDYWGYDDFFEYFNGDISNWDTSKVTNMSYMFHDAERFNRDISSWDTSNVTDMSYMFRDAERFNWDISSWDTSKVTDMSRMFEDAEFFNQDISGWDVKAAENKMFGMFLDAEAFNRKNFGFTIIPQNYFTVLQ